jgi:hypothetical protein
MAFPSVTYTFVNSTSADATEVNTNFTDIINGISDGTKDINISALTCAGSVTLNGTVTLGNATGDDITVNGYLASDILPKTDGTYDLGASGRAFAEIHTDLIVANAATRTVDGLSKRRTSSNQTPTAGPLTLVSGTIISQFDNLVSGRVYTVTGRGSINNDDASGMAEAYVYLEHDSSTKDFQTVTVYRDAQGARRTPYFFHFTFTASASGSAFIKGTDNGGTPVVRDYTASITEEQDLDVGGTFDP